MRARKRAGSGDISGEMYINPGPKGRCNVFADQKNVRVNSMKAIADRFYLRFRMSYGTSRNNEVLVGNVFEI